LLDPCLVVIFLSGYLTGKRMILGRLLKAN
jgi:hypothetical protein